MGNLYRSFLHELLDVLLLTWLPFYLMHERHFSLAAMGPRCRRIHLHPAGGVCDQGTLGCILGLLAVDQDINCAVCLSV